MAIATTPTADGATVSCDQAESARALRDAIARYGAAFDPDALSMSEASSVLEAMVAVANVAAVVKAKAAARVAASLRWRDDGHRSPAHYLARVAGTTVGGARAALEAAERLTSLPATDEAARRGALSQEQVVAIADAASADPAAERRLLDHAARASVGELRDECGRVKAAADADLEARWRRIRAGRSCTRARLADGAEEIRYRSTPDEVALVWSVVEGYAKTEFDRARAEGRRESAEAYVADALLAIARAAAGDHVAAGASRTGTRIRKPLPTKVIVRIDHSALVRGRAVAGEVCDVEGVGPVPVSVVDEIVSTGDPFLAAVVTKGHDVASVVHLGRPPTARQRTALEWCGVRCTVEGCNRTTGLQIDHREDWAETHVTRLTALDFLCQHHHDLKTRRNWALVDGKGKRKMVPPGDPAHPAHPPRAGPTR